MNEDYIARSLSYFIIHHKLQWPRVKIPEDLRVVVKSIHTVWKAATLYIIGCSGLPKSDWSNILSA